MIHLTYEQKQALKRYWWVLLLLFLLVTNPSHIRHKNQLNKRYCERNNLTGAVGAGWVYANLAEYDDWYICSYACVSDKMVSLGFCGMVFVFNTPRI